MTTETEETLDTVREERDAILQAAGFKPGSLARARDTILGDIAGMRPAMVKARREAEVVKSDAMLWQCFVLSGGLLGAGAALRLWRMVQAYRAALTPSGATKFVHHGEFKFSVEGPPDPELDEGDEGFDEPTVISVPVPWTTVKEIMAAIRQDAEVSIR